MKTTKILYWIVTVLLGLGMLFSGISNIFPNEEAYAVFEKLHFPAYIIPFLGVAKVLGAIAVLVPAFPRLKEWAYAGLFFDVTGAIYSTISIGEPAAAWVPTVIIGYGLIFGSYFLYHKKRRLEGRQ